MPATATPQPTPPTPDATRTVADLGRRVKLKYPAYGGIDDASLGRRVKAKYPDAYAEYADLPPAPPPPEEPSPGPTLAPAAPSGSVAPPIATPAGSPSELANTMKPPVQFAAGAVRGAARAAVDFVKSIPGQAEEFYRQGSQRPYLPGEPPAATAARGAGYQEAARTIAAYTPITTPIGKVLPLMVAQGGAQVIQAGQPVETAAGQRSPTAGEVGERVGGGALGLAMGLPGVVHGAVGRVMGKRPIAPTPAEAEAAKANIAPPATLKPQLRSVSEQASQELGRAVDEMQRKGPISFKSNGISIQDAHIVPTLVRVFPEDPNAVRVTVMDNATGEMHSVALPSIAALRGALGQGTRAEIPPAPAERAQPPKKRTQEEYAAQQRVIGQAVAQVPEQVAKVRERIATAPAAIEALERQIAENPNDKQVGRWKRRVENLRGLPEPEPGPVEQPSAATLPKGEVAPRGRTEATTPTPVQEPPMAGTKGPVPATGTVVRAESPAPARPKAPPSTPMPQGNVGRATQIKTPTQTFTARYEEVPISSLKPSHNPATFEPSPAYPFEQQRDYRGNKREQMKVIGMSKDFNPDYLLADTPTSTDGPPIVSNEGYVLGGNARTMALMRGLEAGDIKERDLQRAVMAQGDKFGIEKPGLKKGTIVVRRLTEKMDLPAQARATKVLNEDFKMAVDPISDAVSRARNLTPETVGWLSKALNDAGPDATIKAAIFDDPENLGRLLGKLTDDRVINAPELPRLMDPETDKLTADGQKVIEAAIIGRVIKSPKMIREMSPNLKNVVFSALSPLLKGETFPTEWRINDQVISGLGLYHMADRANKTIDMMLQPQIVSSPFLERMAGDPLAQAVAKWFDANRNKPNALRAALTKHNGLAQDAVSGQGSLLGGTPEPADAFREAFGVKVNAGDFAREPATVTHESRMSGAPATVPRPSRSRGIPIARTAPRVPTKAESVDLPSAEVPELPLRAKAAGPIRKVREALREVVEATNPVRPAVGKNLDLVMRKKGEPKQALFRTEQAQEKVWKFWEESPKSKALDFLNRLESGVQPDPRLAEIDRAYRQRSANVFEAISRWKQLPFWENYFPHMWKDPKKAEVFIQGRRPMEGSKSFLKARQLEDTLAGLKAGLEPVSWNPEELMQMMEHNARKFVTVQELSEEAQSMGSAKRLGIGEKMPEGFRRSNQNWTKIYLNPETPVKEYHDRAIMEGLEGVAKAIGTKLDRQVKIGGRRLGYSEAAPGRTGRVMTKFATPESTLAHEIGHQIDSKYGLQDKFIRKSTPAEKAELRALVDLRLTPGEETTPSFKKYIREGPEKMATLLEALIHAPEAFQKTAPLNYKKFIAFLNSHDELAPLIHIRPSLRLVEGTGTVHAGGVVLGGEIVFQEDLARLLDNHMSKDWVTGSSWGRGFMASRNFLNAVELGFSAFHATGTTILAGMSRASVGISELAHGNPIEAAKKFATSPFAPLSYARTGWKFYKGDPGLIEAIEKEIFTGGASLEKRQYYRNQMIDRFVRNYRRASARGGTPYERAVGGVKALGQAPFAAIEVPIKLLTTRYIPQMKVGAFRELFSSQMRIKAKDIAQGKDTMENVARLAWRDIEDRFGLINYDNEFWNNGLRSAIMVLIRAPGWKLGTARALGGGAFVDMPRFAAAAARMGVEKIKGESSVGKFVEGPAGSWRKAPEWTPRMSFALGMVFTSFSLSAAYQILHTGQAPKNLEDLLHPRNGLRNDDGTPGRINFPTFMRDVQGWTGLTVKGGKVGLKPDVPGFLFGRIEHRGGGSSLFHGGALAPEVTLILDLLENQSYRGPIRDENASSGKQVLQVMRYLFNREQPFSIQQYRALGAHQAARAEQAEAFFGMTPYHEKRDKRPTRFRERY